LDNAFVRQLVVQVLVQETGKVSVHTLISADEFVAEGKAGHETSLFQPENRAEGSRKEDTFDRCKSNQTFSKAAGSLDPLERPVCLLSNTGDVCNSFKEEIFLIGVLA
jgi:hypothetical protein